MREVPVPRLRPGRQRGQLHAPDEHREGRPHRAADDHRLGARRSVQRPLPQLHVLLERGRLDLRVPPRRRRLGRLHEPAELREPRPTAATPSRCAPPTRPATRTRPRPPARGRSTRPRRTRPSTTFPPTRPTTTRRPSSSPRARAGSTFECRLDGGAWDRLREPRDDRPPRRRQPHLRGARHRRRRERRREPRLPHVDGGHGRAGVVLLRRPGRPDQRHDPDLRVLGHRARLELPMSSRRRRLERLREPGDDRPAGRRQPHHRGARHRRRRQPGDDARAVHLARRRRRPVGLDLPAARLRERLRRRPVHRPRDELRTATSPASSSSAAPTRARPARPAPGSRSGRTRPRRTRPPGRSTPTGTGRCAPSPPTLPPTPARPWST